MPNGIASLIDRDGVTDMLIGGAEGADTWAEMTVLSLREKKFRAEASLYPAVSGAVRQLERVSAGAVSGDTESGGFRFYMQREYSEGCMLERNRFMVDHADMLLAVYNGEWRGGTAATVRYATKSGKRIQIINPVVQS